MSAIVSSVGLAANVAILPNLLQPPAKQSHFRYSPSLDPSGYFQQVQIPPVELVTSSSSKEKLCALVCVAHPRGGTLIQEGDVFRCHLLNGHVRYKDVVLTELSIVDGEKNMIVTIAIPPRGHQQSEPDLRADVIFAKKSTEWFCPNNIEQCLKQVEPEACVGNNWKDISVFRDGEELGSIWDLKQAHRFNENEEALVDALCFLSGRKRRWNKKLYPPGWYMADHTALFFKLRLADYTSLNLTGVLDLGNELNALLASCADPGYTIVPYDMRMKNHQDGIPVPRGKTVIDVLEKGWEAFPTAYAQELAKSAFVETWSQGHAHIGPLGLEKHPIGRKADKFDLNGVGVIDNDPAGVDLTPSEIQRVDRFVRNFLQGRIMHWPLPIHRNGSLHGGVISQQWFVNNNHVWELDDRGPDMARQFPADPLFYKHLSEDGSYEAAENPGKATTGIKKELDGY